MGTDIGTKLDEILEKLNGSVISQGNNLSGKITANGAPGYAMAYIYTPAGLQIESIQCIAETNAGGGTPGLQTITIFVGDIQVDQFTVSTSGIQTADLSSVIDKSLDVSIQVNCINGNTSHCNWTITYSSKH